VPTWVECQVCAGRGLVQLMVPSVVPGHLRDAGLQPCPFCGGLGQVEGRSLGQVVGRFGWKVAFLT